MAYQVIARKWRPQTFDEVVFQDHVSKTLKNSIRNGRISHAYIFSGPRGVGKTTMARILAKSLNCVDGPTETPCGVCENCLEIKSGMAFDVIEIDGASNRGIDDIRELRENVNFAPAKGRYKIYIIDEVHMLTKEAFNALLKTLEEPPPHAVFIFATTEMHQIPDTILSRCQKFFFKKIPVGPVVDHLKSIVDREGYKISDGALYPIARSAGGSMRDAQSLLDQVISFSDFREKGDDSIDIEIGEEDALAILGIVPVESFMKLLTCVSSADAAAAMAEIDRVISMGVDIPRYAAGLSDTVRTIRLVKNGISVKEILNLSEEETLALKSITDSFHDEELSLIFRLCADMQNELRFSRNERVTLEMSVLDMIAVKRTPSIAEIIRRLEGLPPESAPKIQAAIPAAVPQAAPSVTLKSDNIPSAVQPRAAEPVAPQNPPQKKDEAASGAIEAWNAFIREAAAKNNSAYILLRPAEASASGDVIRLTFPPGDEFTYYRKSLDREKLDGISAEISSKSGLNLRVVLSDAPLPGIVQRSAEPQKGPVETIKPNEPEDIPPPTEEMAKVPGGIDMKLDNPAVDKIVNAFHGQIIERKGV